MNKENKVEKVYKNISLNGKLFTIWKITTTTYKKIRHLEETIFVNGPSNRNSKMPRDVEKSGNYEIKDLWQKFEVERRFNPNSPRVNPVNLMEVVSSRKGEVLDITSEEYTKLRDKEGKKEELTEKEKEKLKLIKDDNDGTWQKFCVWYEEKPEYSYNYHITKYQPNELKIESLYYPDNIDSSRLQILDLEEWKKELHWLSRLLTKRQLTFEDTIMEEDFLKEYNESAKR